MRKLMAGAAICGLIAVMALAAMVTAQSSPTPTLKTGTSQNFGTILTDAKGMTLYTYDEDKPNQSNCTDAECLGEWPPLVASGQLTLAAGIPGTIGSITRPDGSKQVTYNQMPLYYFVGDQKPGDVTGDGVDEFSVAQVAGGTPAASPAASPAATTTVTVREDAKLGKFFADAQGRTLYIYTPDSPGQSVCNGSCAENWPPLIAKSDMLTLPAGVSGKLSTITRQDGSKQVTYNDKPLYYYAGDKQAGDTNGQNIGGKWFVIAPESANSAPAAPTSTSTSDDYYGH